MKKFWAAVVVIAVVAGLIFLFRSENTSPENPRPQNGAVSATPPGSPSAPAIPQTVPPISIAAPGSTITASNELASRAASPAPVPGSTAAAGEPPTLPPLTVLDKARVVVHNYRTAFGENPVGTNPEITAALMGKNPRQINFVAESGLRVNEKGEMLDGYGTPFFFHQISGQEMEIRSAGQDRIMWTFDDLVTR